MCRQARSDDSRGGFTLIEAVVALALMAVMLAAIGSLIGSATNGARTLEGHVALVETARLVMTSIPRRLPAGDDDLTGEEAGYRWQVHRSPLADDDDASHSPWIPENVAVRVRSPSGAIFTLETVRLVPRGSP